MHLRKEKLSIGDLFAFYFGFDHFETVREHFTYISMLFCFRKVGQIL